jgi:hypothetical protein
MWQDLLELQKPKHFIPKRIIASNVGDHAVKLRNMACFGVRTAVLQDKSHSKSDTKVCSV